MYAGKLYIGLNSDEWLVRKKGRYFMPFEERKAVLESLQCAPNVFGFDDSDNTAINAIHHVASFESDNIRFCNGGDRTSANIPEQNSTYQTNVEFLFGVGGDDKKNSSSWILNNYENQWVERQWGRYKTVHNIDGARTKIFEIMPGESMSMQRHEHRSETWTVLKGVASIQLGGDYIMRLKEQQSHIIRLGEWHRGFNDSNDKCVVLETWFGDNLSEQDIIRNESLRSSAG